MSIKIALAGNPNCGKTTLFNNLTGSNQYVGNWPGVTVEKKEGKLKGEKDVIIQDLPGIYSLSPYTLEEVVSRTYLVKEKPDAILNIIDGTNIERNLYLTTQLIELGIPVVMAVNMIDLVRKNGDKIDLKKLSAELGCQAVEISALKGEGTEAAAKAAVAAAKATKAAELPHVFTGSVEHAIAHIEESIQGKVDDRFLRWYAVKLFERDEKVMDELKLDKSLIDHIAQHIIDHRVPFFLQNAQTAQGLLHGGDAHTGAAQTCLGASCLNAGNAAFPGEHQILPTDILCQGVELVQHGGDLLLGQRSGGICLGVAADVQHTLPGQSQGGGNIGSDGGFADAAFSIKRKIHR